MNRSKDTFYLFALAGLALVGLIVLLAIGRAVPVDMWTLAGILVGALAGIARQDTSVVVDPTSSAPPATQTAPVAPSPAPQAAQPAPSAPAAPPALQQ